MSDSLKIICTDFDGTIFADHAEPAICPELLARIGGLQQAGVRWCVNTGRDLASVMEELARARSPILPDWVVAVEREIYHREEEELLPVAEWNEQCAAAHRELFAGIRRELSGLTERVKRRHHATIFSDVHSPFSVVAASLGEMDAIQILLDEFCATVAHLSYARNDVYARLCHARFNKGTALAEVSRHCGVGPAAVFAAGDHHNDLPMLDDRFAHWLTCPNNAIPVVRQRVLEQGGHAAAEDCGAGVLAGLERALSATKTS